jgi:hypothetical protein
MIEPVAPPEWPRYEVSRNGQPNPGPSPKDHRTEQVRIFANRWPLVKEIWRFRVSWFLCGLIMHT